MASNELKLTVPDNIIEAHVRSAVAKALTADDPELLIKNIVDTALLKKGYGSQTVFEEATEKLIHKVAEGILLKWIEEHRPEIEKALHAGLQRSKSKLVKAFVDGIFENAVRYRNINVKFEVIGSE